MPKWSPDRRIILTKQQAWSLICFLNYSLLWFLAQSQILGITIYFDHAQYILNMWKFLTTFKIYWKLWKKIELADGWDSKYWILFFYQSPKTFCIKSKIFVLVQNKFGPIKDRASNWIFLHRYNYNLTSKNNLFHFITTPPQRICIRFKSGLFTNYVSIHEKAPKFHEFAISRICEKTFFTSNQNFAIFINLIKTLEKLILWFDHFKDFKRLWF